MPPISTNDHCTVGVHLNFKIAKDLAYTNFEACFEMNDPNDAAVKWTETFLNISRTIVPNKVVTVRPNDVP